MHHLFPVFVEAESKEKAEEIAVCLWAGTPEHCGDMWPTGVRLSWEKGIYWDYIDTEPQIAITDEELEIAGIDPKTIKHLPRCSWGEDFCVDFPKRVSELGYDVARAIAISALKWGALILYYYDEENEMYTTTRDLDEVLRILKEKPDKIWVVYVDMHE